MSTEEKLIEMELTLREFAGQVKRMRDAQNKFFEGRSNEALRLAKHLERIVDRAVDRMMNDNPFKQQELFKE